MAETFGFFDAEELTDGTFDREYIAEQWANYFKLFVGNGVFATPTNQLKVVADTGMFVKISIGWAFINGYWYHNDTELEVEIPANMTASTITDGIFIRWNSADREIKAVVGVDRTTPNRVAPYYELKLADIVVSTGATQITDAEITDTRMDSSVCGIVTGVIDVIDAGNLFAQYQAIFTQWMNSTDTDFDEWRDNQEALYTQWYNAIRAQQTQDLEDFDAWFDAIKGQLSEDAAGHLQNEIDDIIAQGLSGSIFTITTTQTELYGKDVTITGSNITKTGKFSAQGVAIITGFTDVGTITITSTDNLETATTVMSIPYFGRYTATLAFWSATVNLEGDERLYGSTITVKDSDNLTVGTVVLSVLDGTGVFTATAPDTYTFITTLEGETYTWELEVSQETTYNLELFVGFNWEGWLTAGNVDPTDYEDLDEVLEDEKALWKLFTKHSSVDFLADVSEVDDDITKIFNNDLVAKWINLRDYALDILHANEVLAEVMDEADKYGYGEWALMPQVPKMTSNTAPSGVASASLNQSGYEAWRAFDGDYSNFAVLMTGADAANYLRYEFVNPTLIKKCSFLTANTSATRLVATTASLQGSNDGTNWITLGTTTTVGTSTPTQADMVKWYDIDASDNEDEYKYYQVYFANSPAVISNTPYNYMAECQFYAWAPKGNVPVMTANTAPYGVASASSSGSSGVGAYGAFDGNSSTVWSSNVASTGTLTYKFVAPICAKRIRMLARWYSPHPCMKDFDVKASNDGTTFTTLGSFTYADNNKVQEFDIENENYYLYYQISSTATYDTYNPGIAELQFYGRELKVSVPIMSNFTSPFGEVKESGRHHGTTPAPHYGWKAFDADDSDGWFSNIGSGVKWLRYDFVGKIVPKFIYLYGLFGQSSTGNEGIVQGSNDGFVDNVHDLETFVCDNGKIVVTLEGTIEYSSIRFYTDFYAANANNYCYLYTAKIYGFDYSERDFDENLNYKTLYDHGLELEEITSNGGTLQIVKQNSYILINDNSSSDYLGAEVINAIDLTNYSLMRANTDRYHNSANATLAVNQGTTASSSIGVNTMPYNNALDVSNINQSYKVEVYGGSSTSATGMTSINEWWLE